MPHIARPVHRGRHPVHVTLRVGAGIPSLRTQSMLQLFAAVLRSRGTAGYRPYFRVVHFSLQTNHVHLLVEADTEAARGAGIDSVLRSGITGLKVAFARRLNKWLGRRGPVWSDRYHRHDLRTPRETAHALRYVLQNHAHHGRCDFGGTMTDPWSTAWLFDGWSSPVFRIPDVFRALLWPVDAARSWLLRVGALRRGPLPLA